MADVIEELFGQPERTPKTLLKLVIEQKRITAKEAASNLKVNIKTINEWAHALSEKNYIDISEAKNDMILTPSNSIKELASGKPKAEAKDVDFGKKCAEVETELGEKTRLLDELKAELMEEKKANAILEENIEKVRKEDDEKLSKKLEKLNEEVERERSERRKLERILEGKKPQEEGEKRVNKFKKPVEEVGKIVEEPKKLVNTVMDRPQPTAEVTDERITILQEISKKNEVGVDELAAKSEIEKEQVKKVLQELEKDGLIRLRKKMLGGYVASLVDGVDVEKIISDIKIEKIKAELRGTR